MEIPAMIREGRDAMVTHSFLNSLAQIQTARRLGRHVIYEQEMVSRRTRRHKQRSWLLYRFLSGPMMDPSCRHARRNRGDDHLLPAITRDSRNDCCEDDDPCKSVPRPNVLARAKIKKIDDVPGSTVLHTLASHTKGALQQSFSVLCRQTSPFTF